MQIIRIRDFRQMPGKDNESLYDLAPGEYRAWAYHDDPDSLSETKVLVIEDPYQDDDGTQFGPDVFIQEKGFFINISSIADLPTVYAVQKIS